MTHMIRERIVFYGRVQGVGFRYTATYLAKSLNLTGWVMNEYDGSVVMEVQGSQYAIDQLILSLKDQRYIKITDVVRADIPVDPGERRFRSRYY